MKSVYECAYCTTIVAVARTTDNQIAVIDKEPNPNGNLRISGKIDEEPTIWYGDPDEDFVGNPIDQTTYSRHTCVWEKPSFTD